MRRLEEFVNEKLKVTKGNVPPDIPLGKQGWICTSVNSIYNEIYQADDFFKVDIDLMSLYSMDAEDYTEMLKDRFHPFRVECEFQHK